MLVALLAVCCAGQEHGDSRFVREDKRSSKDKRKAFTEQASLLRKQQNDVLSNPVPPKYAGTERDDSDDSDEEALLDEATVDRSQRANLLNATVTASDINGCVLASCVGEMSFRCRCVAVAMVVWLSGCLVARSWSCSGCVRRRRKKQRPPRVKPLCALQGVPLCPALTRRCSTSAWAAAAACLLH